MKLVSIITVNFNHSHVTDEFLDAFYRTNQYLNFEIIVVDNGSKENPVPAWSNKYPLVQFLRSEINLGFAGGNNLGVAHAKGDLLFFVNNDTEFTEGLVQKLVDTIGANPQTGMISPKIRYFQQPDTLQYAGYTEMNYFTARNACIGQFEKDHGQFDHLSGFTGFGHGAAMMITREAINKAGLMAENYFLYYEELDWGARIKKAGFEIRLEMGALIYHKESVSVGQKSALKEFFMNRNRILFIRRNANTIQKLVFYFHFLFLVTPRNIISYLKEGQYKFIPLLFKAIWWNLTNSVESPDLGYSLT
ncbi:MAG TPA: glycosyltransferase family 2 protein [Sediminibacterium sp.]|nr:glycosyltransferase family 2 protein [Sediminibacterium sp.]